MENQIHPHLRHVDQPGLCQTIAFNLYDCLPAALRHEWETILELEQPLLREARLQAYVDRGYGSCLLRNPRCAREIENQIRQYHEEKYRLLAWVIMPNHVHVLVVPFSGWKLAEIMRDWKSASARAINLVLQRTGRVWQRDYFDHFIRGDTHLKRALLYIHNNPVKAGFVKEPRDWPFSSARFLDEPDMMISSPYLD